MKFSVLMSVYKNEKAVYFQQALESLLIQTILPNEIVVVKDGLLTAELENICHEYKEKYSQLFKFIPLEKNVGLGKALAVGLEYCQYEIIARMDTDDICKSYRFAKQLIEFEQDTELMLLGGFIEEFSVNPDCIDRIRTVPLSNVEIYDFAKKRNPFNHMTVMFRKKAVLLAGNYQSMYLSEDYYLWIRMLQSGSRMRNIPDILVSVRADLNMFQRRGGFKYFVTEVNFQKILYQKEFINKFELIRNIFIRFVVRNSPNIVRRYIYRQYMRNKHC